MHDGERLLRQSEPGRDDHWVPVQRFRLDEEISFDLDMVSTACPLCHILLVEANSSNQNDLLSAEDIATAHASYVSNSWGGAESSDQTDSDAHFNHPGVAITFSSGDGSYAAGAQYPATSKYVTAVGGTTLVRANNARGWSESAWFGAGTGCSLTVSAVAQAPAASAAMAGGAYAWGDNSVGMIGDGTRTSESAPVPVHGLPSNIRQVASGGDFSLALLPDGTVWAWGQNISGELGTSPHVLLSSTTPVQVPGLSGIIQIAASGETGFALSSNQTLWAWGDNFFGELGQGAGSSLTMPESDTPVQVLTGVVQVSSNATSDHVLALRSDFTVWSWGADAADELGRPADPNSFPPQGDTPTLVAGLGREIQVSAGGEFSLSLDAQGTVEGWGDSSSGELGKTLTGPQAQPAPIAGLSHITQIAAGQEHALAVGDSGSSVWAWGDDLDGELGDNFGSGFSSDVPIHPAHPYSGPCVPRNSARLEVLVAGLSWGDGRVAGRGACL